MWKLKTPYEKNMASHLPALSGYAYTEGKIIILFF